MRSKDICFDVTETIGLDERLEIIGTLHLPDMLSNDTPLELILALHGGGYRRSYWNPSFADESYSFARYFIDRGKAVLALDHLGMGDSSKPDPESLLSRAVIATANATALDIALGSLRDGTYARASDVSVTGVGHSIGGMMIITQAAAHGAMDRVAVLGWANQPMVLGDMDVSTLSSTLIPHGYIATPRPAMRALFYAPDVPLSLVEADEADGCPTPSCLARDALTPAIVHAASAAITTPVLIVHSVVDTSPDPWGEVPYFRGSNNVTLQVLDGAAHCQNFASTRHDHWENLNRWIDSTSV